jgi:hypothetical protein
MFVMSRGPADLASVRWLVYPFVGALAALILYIVVYLAQLTNRKPPTVSAGPRNADNAASAHPDPESCVQDESASAHAEDAKAASAEQSRSSGDPGWRRALLSLRRSRAAPDRRAPHA